MPFKPNSFFKFNVNHYDFFINLRDLHKIFYTLCKEILNDYDLYKNTSRKTLLTLILKDKVMIVLYILVLLIIIATVTAYMLHI